MTLAYTTSACSERRRFLGNLLLLFIDSLCWAARAGVPCAAPRSFEVISWLMLFCIYHTATTRRHSSLLLRRRWRRGSFKRRLLQYGQSVGIRRTRRRVQGGRHLACDNQCKCAARPAGSGTAVIDATGGGPTQRSAVD